MARYSYSIEGGVPLRGEVQVSSSEIAAAGVIAASLLSTQPITIKQLPDTPAIKALLECVRFLGVDVQHKKQHTVTITATQITTRAIPQDYTNQTMYTGLLWSTLYGRFKKASIALPPSRIQTWFEFEQQKIILQQLSGQELETNKTFITAQGANALSEYALPYHSRISSLHALLIGAGTDVGLVIKNFSQDPEVIGVLEALAQMGVRFETEAPDVVRVYPETTWRSAEVTLPPDRDEAVFWALSGILSKGDIEIQRIQADQLTAFTSKLSQLGIPYRWHGDQLHIWYEAEGTFQPVEFSAGDYPGFPDRWALWLLPFLTQTSGVSRISFSQEKFIEPLHEELLEKFMAEISLEGVHTHVYGPTTLQAAEVNVFDKREVLLSLLAAFNARGTTVLSLPYPLSQLFDNFEGKLTALEAGVQAI